MTDQNSQFFAILTAVGKAKQANADALGIPWTFAQMGVGDANDTDPIPNEQQTRLINERRRAPLNQLSVDPTNPNIIIAEQVIPENIGGWWIREVGLYDADGDLVAVANCAPSYKPLLTQGSGRTQVVRMNLIVSNTANVDLKIDPSVVLATRKYVDGKILEELSKLDIKQSVRAATTGNINLVGLQVVDGVSLNAGDRVLVKNQTTAKDNGPYEVAVGAWTRAKDADNNSRVTPNLTVAIEAGATQADTIWQLVTDGPIIVGTTALTFKDITDGLARLLSPSFAGNPTAPTPARFDSSKSLATTEFAKLRGVEFSGFTTNSASLALSSAHVGGLHSFSDAVQLTATMPPSSGIAQGATITLACAGPGGLRVVGAGADVIYTSTGVSGPMVLALGDTAEFIRLEGQWRLVGGTVALRYAGVASGPNFVTQPQFDSSKALATTEFVKRMGFEWSGFNAISVSTVLGIGSVGGAISAASATPISVTLPPTGLATQGATIFLTSAGAGAVTLLASGADLLTSASGVPVSLALGQGETALLSRVSSEWRLIGGTAALRHSAVFASSLGVTGWRRLPSGDIEQWGLSGGSAPNVNTLITFPMAFPNACVNVQLTFVDTSTPFPASRGAPVQVGNYSRTQFYYSHAGTNAGAGSQHFWTARGN